MGDAADAAETAGRVRELAPPAFTTGTFLQALALYHAGRFAEARTLLEGLELAWAPDAPAATLALVDVALGDSAAARAALTRLDPEASTFSHALVRAALGETRPAIDAIAGIERWEYWPTFAVHYFFPRVLTPLRSDPRYTDILQRVHRSWGGDPGPPSLDR